MDQWTKDGVKEFSDQKKKKKKQKKRVRYYSFDKKCIDEEKVQRGEVNEDNLWLIFRCLSFLSDNRWSFPEHVIWHFKGRSWKNINDIHRKCSDKDETNFPSLRYKYRSDAHWTSFQRRYSSIEETTNVDERSFCHIGHDGCLRMWCIGSCSISSPCSNNKKISCDDLQISFRSSQVRLHSNLSFSINERFSLEILWKRCLIMSFQLKRSIHSKKKIWNY